VSRLASQPASFDVQITVLPDGSSTCSDDIDFELVGFTVTGRVSTPSFCDSVDTSLTVTLEDAAARTPDVLAARLSANGEFKFEPVRPGAYTARISHASWTFSPQELPVLVDSSPVAVVGEFQLAGATLRGIVHGFDGLPLAGVGVHLLSPSSGAFGCSASQPPHRFLGGLLYTHVSTHNNHVCSTITDAAGAYEFPDVKPSKYIIVPTHKVHAARAGLEHACVFIALRMSLRADWCVVDHFFARVHTVHAHVCHDSRANRVPC
jgi:hypothetical protein